MLKIKNLSFAYSKSKKQPGLKAIGNISLEIKEGAFVSIIGPSGCGKTTLANLIAGYLKTEKGSIAKNGKIIKKPGRDRIVISQENDLFTWMTAKQNIEFASNEKKPARDYLELVHLTGFENKYPHELSGGMKKRVSLARALAANAEFIIMDEAFSSLDYQIKENLYLELLNIWKKTRKTIVLITHDIEEAIYLSDKIILLSKRPTKIKKIINIPFARPRKESIKDSKEFMKIKKEIQGSLETFKTG